MSFSRPTGNSNTGNTDYDKLGKGRFKARLITVANLGMFQDTYKGELKDPAPKMALQVEIIGKPVKIGDDMKPRQMWVSPFNFFSKLTPKGNELKYYTAFDEMAEASDVPDWEAMLGKAIYVVVKPSDDDNAYDNIVALSAMDEEVANNLDAAESELMIDNVEGNERLEGRLFGLAKYQYEQPHYEAEGATSGANQATPEDDPTEDDPF